MILRTTHDVHGFAAVPKVAERSQKYVRRVGRHTRCVDRALPPKQSGGDVQRAYTQLSAMQSTCKRQHQYGRVFLVLLLYQLLLYAFVLFYCMLSAPVCGFVTAESRWTV